MNIPNPDDVRADAGDAEYPRAGASPPLLRAERWLVEVERSPCPQDATEERIKITVPSTADQRQMAARTKALGDLLRACDVWAAPTGDTRGRSDPHDDALRDAIWTARRLGVIEKL